MTTCRLLILWLRSKKVEQECRMTTYHLLDSLQIHAIAVFICSGFLSLLEFLVFLWFDCLVWITWMLAESVTWLISLVFFQMVVLVLGHSTVYTGGWDEEGGGEGEETCGPSYKWSQLICWHTIYFSFTLLYLKIRWIQV